MPPTNAELTAQVEQLTTEKAELEAKVAELEAAPAPEPADGVSTEAHEAVLAENEALKVEVEKAREERDRAKEQASGASQNAEAIQQVQDHPGSVLNPNGQDTVPKEMPVAPNAADLQTDSEPCPEHNPKGWPAEELGASTSCEHGRWVYGQTPKTRPE